MHDAELKRSTQNAKKWEPKNLMPIFLLLRKNLLASSWSINKMLSTASVQHSHDTDGKKLYSDEERIKELSNETDQFVAHSIFSQLALLTQERARYVELFKEYDKKYCLIGALSSIPGIAEVRACIIAATVCSASRFESKFKFWAYSMLVKYDCKSDDVSYGKKRVPGNRGLKDVFMGAAQSVIEQKQKNLYAFYQAQLEKGLDHSAAKKNLARKIAAIALAVMRKGKHYQDDYEVKIEKQVAKKV